MVSIMSLWLPIVVAAVLVFVASSIIHTVLTYHDGDFDPVPNQDEVMDALRGFSIPPGDYVLPRPASRAERGSDEFKEKMNRGPIAFLNVFPSGPPKMGASLVQWAVYCIIVGIFAAYITSRAAGPGAEYLTVFRFAGATAFFCYSVALWQNSIWLKRKWSATFKSTFDGFIYALLTAGAFGWLWPG
jgi:hypothetical protein